MIEKPEPNFDFSPGSRVLVTGATEFTGSNLIRKLLHKNIQVVAIARPSSPVEQFSDLPIEWVRGNVYDKDTVSRAVRGVNTIFNLAATLNRAPASYQEEYKVHVVATQLLAQTALQEDAFQRFVQISTVGVYGNIKNPPADENYPMNPQNNYEKTKAQAELWLQEFSEKNKLPITVVRPCGIYGPGDKRLFKLFRMVSRGWVPLFGSGNHLYHLTHVDDLASFLILAAVHPKAIGEVFICAGPKSNTFRRIISIISEYYGIRVKYIPLPVLPFLILGAGCEFFCRPFHIKPPVFRSRVTFFIHDRAFSVEKMKKHLGFVPAHSDEEGLRETAQWYLDHRWITVT